MALALPEADREQLADELYGSITPNEIDREWGEEAERRSEEIRSELVKTVSAEEAMAHARSRLKKK